MRVAVSRHASDLLALTALNGLLALLAGNRIRFDAWLASFDTLSFYIPVYGHLGQRLRDLDVPAWNPHLFSGTPFAGDPQSGWTYLLAMLSFSLLNPVSAFKLMVTLQLVIASLSSYALARCLGMAPVAALAAGVVYGYGPFINWGAGDGTVMAHVAAWLPAALLGSELALRAKSWRWVAGGCWIGAVAVSQIIAGWIGQGSAYGLLVVAAYIGYRGLLSPAVDGRNTKRRVATTLVVGSATLVLGVALGAAGLLPRLALHQSTTLGEGYDGLVGTGATYRPMDLGILLFRTLGEGKARAAISLGGAVFVLAFLAPLLARRRWAVPFFTGLTLIALVLTQAKTPIHQLFYLIPRFEDLHTHDPWHVMVVVPLGVSMLVAATVQELIAVRHSPRDFAAAGLAAAAFAAAATFASRQHAFIGWIPVLSAFVALMLVVAGLLARQVPRFSAHPKAPLAIASLLVVLLAVHQGGVVFAGSWLGWPRDSTWESTWDSNPARDAAIAANGEDTDAGGAGEYLQRRQTAGEIFRYLGYGGFNNSQDPDRFRHRSHMTHRLDARVTGLLVNGRPLLLGLEEVQGYNPVQLRRYAEFITAINGVQTDYHVLYLLPSGIISPLTSLLNLRFVVLDRSLPPDREDVISLTSGRNVVFQNDLVSVYEDPEPPPRAWIVHDVQSVEPGEALGPLLEGAIDPLQTALVEGELPETSNPSAESGEVRVLSSSPDGIVLETTSSAPGFLVVSEIFEEGWKATLDGADVEIFATNHILQGVSLPAGRHTVELRYAPDALRAGLLISGITIVALIATLFVIAWDWRKPFRPSPDSQLEP